MFKSTANHRACTYRCEKFVMYWYDVLSYKSNLTFLAAKPGTSFEKKRLLVNRTTHSEAIPRNTGAGLSR
eukprot:3416299-Prorocentrum_lima.AAC.1